MTTQRLPIGELDVLIMGKVLPIRKAPAAEQHAIAETLTGRLQERIAERFSFRGEFDVTGIYDGCIRVTYALAIGLPEGMDSAAAAVASYADFKQGVRDLWNHADGIVEFMAEGRACTARYAGARLIDRLFGPVAGDESLAGLVPKLNCSDVTREQAMIAIYEANPASFDNDNLNLLRTGCVLAIPDCTRIAGIPVQRANMKVLKHMRRFRARPE